MSRIFFGCQAVAPHMEKQRSGRIIKLSSQAGKTGGLRQPGIVDDHPGDRFQRQR